MASETVPPTVDRKGISTDEMIGTGLISVIKPTVENLDIRVFKVKRSQEELSLNIDSVTKELRSIAESMPNPHDLDPYIKRLSNARHKINIVSSVLHNSQDRLRKLHQHILKEIHRKEALLKQQQSTSVALKASQPVTDDKQDNVISETKAVPIADSGKVSETSSAESTEKSEASDTQVTATTDQKEIKEGQSEQLQELNESKEE